MLKTKSSILIAICTVMFFLSIAAFGIHVKNHVVPKEPALIKRGVDILKGEAVKDSMSFEYSHLHVTFPEVMIDGRMSGVVHMEGIDTAYSAVQIESRNDTLYVSYKNDMVNKPIGGNAEVAIDIHVGGKGLQSITVTDEGSIKTPLRAKGADKEGNIIYPQEKLDRYTLYFEKLDLMLSGFAGGYQTAPENGNVHLLLDGRELNVKVEDQKGMGGSVLRGKVDEINVVHTDGSMNLDAQHVEAKVVRINQDKNKSRGVYGHAFFNVSDSLYCNLYSTLDVYYSGDPVVKKVETKEGRVVHVSKD